MHFIQGKKTLNTPPLITETFTSLWPVTVWLSVQTQLAGQWGWSCARARSTVCRGILLHQKSLFLTSLFEAEYKRILQEITNALVLTENISSGDKVESPWISSVCVVNVGEPGCGFSYTAQKIEKIIQEGMVFLSMFGHLSEADFG